MSYDKPKVTIDLDEYNELVEKSKEIEPDKWVVISKQIVLRFSLASNHYGRAGIYSDLISEAIKNLRDKGISISIDPTYGSGLHHIDAVKIDLDASINY